MHVHVCMYVSVNGRGNEGVCTAECMSVCECTVYVSMCVSMSMLVSECV